MRAKDIALAIFLMAMWGFNFVVIEWGLKGLPPILFSALRFAFTALPLVFFVPRPKLSWSVLSTYGFLQFSLTYGFMFLGMQLGFPAGLTSIAIQAQIFFTIVLAILFLHERPSIVQLTGVAVACAGLLVILLNIGGNNSTLIGFGVIMLGALSWSMANLLTKKIGPFNPLELVVWGAVPATPILLLASLYFEGWSSWQMAWHEIDTLSVFAVLFEAYLTTALGYSIWCMLVHRYPAATITPYALLMPVFGYLSAWLLLHEKLGGWQLTASGLILLGLVLNQLNGRLFLR